MILEQEATQRTRNLVIIWYLQNNIYQRDEIEKSQYFKQQANDVDRHNIPNRVISNFSEGNEQVPFFKINFTLY